MWIIFVFGFIENSFVLMILLLHKSRCTVAEIYLGNLAFADLLFICGLPFWAIYVSNHFYWPFGSFLCVFVSALIQFNLYGSIYFITMVSFDRYLALVKTMSFGRMRRVGCAKFNCVIIWVCAVMVSMPKSIFRTVHNVPGFNTTACLIMPPSDDWHIAANILMNIVGFLIPVPIILFCTFHIIKVLRNNSMQKCKCINTEKKATVLALAVCLAFIICWLPLHIIIFVETLDLFHVFSGCSVNKFIQIGTQISSFIGYSNSCINPLLYVMVGNNFRKKIKEVFEQFKSRQQRSNNESIPSGSSVDTTRTSISMGTKRSRI
ncbi:B2 bradykinin receptor-like [Rhinophrynus dorsalis]